MHSSHLGRPRQIKHVSLHALFVLVVLLYGHLGECIEDDVREENESRMLRYEWLEQEARDLAEKKSKDSNPIRRQMAARVLKRLDDLARSDSIQNFDRIARVVESFVPLGAQVFKFAKQVFKDRPDLKVESMVMGYCEISEGLQRVLQFAQDSQAVDSEIQSAVGEFFSLITQTQNIAEEWNSYNWWNRFWNGSYIMSKVNYLQQSYSAWIQVVDFLLTAGIHVQSQKQQMNLELMSKDLVKFQEGITLEMHLQSQKQQRNLALMSKDLAKLQEGITSQLQSSKLLQKRSIETASTLAEMRKEQQTNWKWIQLGLYIIILLIILVHLFFCFQCRCARTSHQRSNYMSNNLGRSFTVAFSRQLHQEPKNESINPDGSTGLQLMSGV